MKLTVSHLTKALAVTAVIALTGCTSSSGKWGFPYVPSVQQGNWITQQQVDQLRKGLTPEQVTYILGSPLMVDVFDAYRWVYPYYFKPGWGKAAQRNLILNFDKQGLLANWQADAMPSFQPYEAKAGYRVKDKASEKATSNAQEPVTSNTPVPVNQTTTQPLTQ